LADARERDIDTWEYLEFVDVTEMDVVAAVHVGA
jgi:hypothetical protein